jgi:hypothetical protein
MPEASLVGAEEINPKRFTGLEGKVRNDFSPHHSASNSSRLLISPAKHGGNGNLCFLADCPGFHSQFAEVAFWYRENPVGGVRKLSTVTG